MGKANTYNTFGNISSGGTGTSEALCFLKVHSVNCCLCRADSHFLLILMTLTLTSGGVDEKKQRFSFRDTFAIEIS